jgi:hypothetical protein
VPLESGGGGGVSEVVDVVSLGVPEPGTVSLLPGTGLGGVVSLDGPGALGTLAGDSLVGGGVLVPLGTGGGVSETSDCVSLGGVNDPPSLLPGTTDPGDGPGLKGGAPLDGPAVLGCEVGD